MARRKRTLHLPEFGERLSEVMSAQSVSQSALAAACQVDQGTVSRWTEGTIPAKETLDAIARCLATPWQWLLVGNDGYDKITQFIGQRDDGDGGAVARLRRSPRAPTPAVETTTPKKARGQRRPA